MRSTSEDKVRTHDEDGVGGAWSDDDPCPGERGHSPYVRTKGGCGYWCVLIHDSDTLM